VLYRVLSVYAKGFFSEVLCYMINAPLYDVPPQGSETSELATLLDSIAPFNYPGFVPVLDVPPIGNTLALTPTVYLREARRLWEAANRNTGPTDFSDMLKLGCRLVKGLLAANNINLAIVMTSGEQANILFDLAVPHIVVRLTGDNQVTVLKTRYGGSSATDMVRVFVNTIAGLMSVTDALENLSSVLPFVKEAAVCRLQNEGDYCPVTADAWTSL